MNDDPELKNRLYALNERYWDLMDELAKIVTERAVLMDEIRQEQSHE